MPIKGLAPSERVAPAMNRIRLLHTSSIARVDELICGGHRRGRGASWHSSKFHMVVPLSGAFVWHANCGEVVADVNQVLFVRADEDAAFSHPLGSERSMVITPRSDIEGRTATSGSGIRRQSSARVASFRAQLAVRRLLAVTRQQAGTLEADELLVEALTLLDASGDVPTLAVAGKARATVERAKTYLHAHPTDAISLADIASATGVCPVYLTQLFRRAEGLPLYQYVLKLRLASALETLPGCEDITTLAFELGFSSHSHFSSVFRKRFGVSPSRFRQDAAFGPLPVDGRLFSSTDLSSDVAFIRSDPLCVARGGHKDAMIDEGTAP